jgi:hypothetical protein
MTQSDDWRRSATAEQLGSVARTIDPSVAHIARIQDYWLGGKDHFEADRIAGDEAIAQLPDMVASVRNTRAFLGRTVRFLVQEQGIRQFLDVGTGIPTASNTHEVAQRVAPDSSAASWRPCRPAATWSSPIRPPTSRPRRWPAWRPG